MQDNGDGTAVLSGTATIDEVGRLHAVKLVVEDLAGFNSQQDFSLYVKLENSPPTIDSIAAINTYPEDTDPINLPLTGITAGEEVNQNLSVLVTSSNNELIEDLIVDYTSPSTDGMVTVIVARDKYGEAELTIRVEDDGPASLNYIEEIFNLTITPVNDLPVFATYPDTLFAPGDNFSYFIEIEDVDPNDTLTIFTQQVPNWLTLVDYGNGTALLSGEVPQSGEGFDVVLAVNDGSNQLVSQSFTIYLNSPPVILSGNVEVFEDSLFNFNKTIFNEQASDIENDTLTEVRIESITTNGILSFNSNPVVPGQIISVSELEKLSYMSNPDYNGADSFTWSGKDPVSFSVEPGTTEITINPVNDPPLLANIETENIVYKQGSGNQLVTETITISDKDNSSIQGAKIIIAGNYLETEDRLVFEDTDSIKSSFDNTTGILILEGSDSKSNYELALHNVSYVNSNLDDTSIEDRLIEISVWDEEDSSNIEYRIIEISEVKPEPDFISAFTPNGDGVNDNWEIRKLAAYSSVNVYIYNSEGVLVFESDDYVTPWDGTNNGKTLPGGAYYFKVILNNGEREYEGIVNILR